MKNLFTITAVVLCGLYGEVLHADVSGSAVQSRGVHDQSSAPIAFTKNMGQWPDSVLFRADAGGVAVWITRTGVIYQFTRRIDHTYEDDAGLGSNCPTMNYEASSPRGSDPMRDSLENMLVQATFIGANPNIGIVAEGLMEYRCNYFLGNDESKWRTDVPNYEVVVLQNVYDGVDLRCSGSTDGKLSYQYEITPGANADQIKLTYAGVDRTSVNVDGVIIAETKWGAFKGLLPPPTNGTGPVSGDVSLIVKGAIVANSEDGATDYRNLDAGGLVYCTFLGGSSSSNMGGGIAVDSYGCAYVTGSTKSLDFPTLNAYDDSYNGHYDSDVFVTKFSAAGNTLIYSTFLGGSRDEEAWDIAVDGFGCAYVTGYTESSGFPTQSAYDDSFNGGGYYYYDAYVTKLSAEGNTLIYSTFLGGSDDDWTGNIAVDGFYCAYVTGTTKSTNFPTQNSYEMTYQGGIYDAFLTKLSAAGNSLLYSTYLGGGGGDSGNGIAVDSSGCAYVTGTTSSADFPTLNFCQTWQGSTDVFVTKFTAAGNVLIYSTFLGGRDEDRGLGIAIDRSGCAYVTGLAESSDFPTENAFDASFNSGEYNSGDVFVTKFSTGGNTLVYSTFLGGSVDDLGTEVKVDSFGCAYVTGYTESADFPTLNAYDASFNGGGSLLPYDVFVTKLSASGDALAYSTYLGGSDTDEGRGLAVDNSGCAYVTGRTGSSDFPTQNAYDASFNSGNNGWDVFVTKFDAFADTDSDGSPDVFDNCPSISNPDQQDSDGDNFGDVCDECTDTDGDGYGNPGYAANTCAVDNCPDDANPGQEDTDGDLIGDACDCCLWRAGDANNSGDDEPTIGDIGALIDVLFLAGTCDGVIQCMTEADLNQSGGPNPICDDITISDIGVLISYMFINGPYDPVTNPEGVQLPNCL